MTFTEIKELMQEFDKSGIHSLKIEDKDFKIKLSKQEVSYISPPQSLGVAPVVSLPPQTASAQNTAQKLEDTNCTSSLSAIKAPIVGVFYRSASPTTPPYVSVGDKVSAGDIVCLIEAMKIINEIKSPISGVVKNILVTDGDLVGFNDILIQIEEQ